MAIEILMIATHMFKQNKSGVIIIAVNCANSYNQENELEFGSYHIVQETTINL